MRGIESKNGNREKKKPTVLCQGQRFCDFPT